MSKKIQDADVKERVARHFDLYIMSYFQQPLSMRKEQSLGEHLTLCVKELFPTPLVNYLAGVETDK